MTFYTVFLIWAIQGGPSGRGKVFVDIKFSVLFQNRPLQNGTKELRHVWISSLPATQQLQAAKAQPISPDRICVTKLSRTFFAWPCNTKMQLPNSSQQNLFHDHLDHPVFAAVALVEGSRIYVFFLSRSLRGRAILNFRIYLWYFHSRLPDVILGRGLITRKWFTIWFPNMFKLLEFDLN